MKKNGFTLIELIVVLGILSICSFIIYPHLNSYDEKKLAMEMEHGVNGTIEFINSCKMYARNNYDNRKLFRLVIQSRELNLYHGTVKVHSYLLPDSLRIHISNDASISIPLDIDGNTSMGRSINIYDSEGRREVITIKVGTDYVSKQK